MTVKGNPAPNSPWRAGDKERVADMFARGMTARETADQLGLKTTQIAGAWQKMGLRRLENRGSLRNRFEAKVSPEPNSGCWLWCGGANQQGYGLIRVRDRGQKLATHISLELAGRPLPAGMLACHRCDNPPCVNPDHLFAGSPQDNAQDAKAKGRSSPPPILRGSNNPGATCTEDDVLHIRESRANGETLTAIAARMGMKKSAVGYIAQGKTWRHV